MSEMADPGGARMECPRCGREVAPGVECSACGVVFDKYRSRHRRARAGESEGAPPPPTESGSPLPRTLLVLLMIAAAIFAYDRARDKSAAAAAVEDAAPVPTEPRLAQPRGPEPTERVAARGPAPTAGRPPVSRAPVSHPPISRPPTAAPAPTAPAEQPRARPTTYSYDWHEGAHGFARGLEEARTDGRAMAVYFHTDWCGYCRQLESELLDRARVENYLKYLTKVRINPERGRNERLIADRYGVTGYPSFFVHPAADRGPTKVSGMKKRHGEWRVKTPEEFVESIRRVVGDG